jgi:hypothetical protein
VQGFIRHQPRTTGPLVKRNAPRTNLGRWHYRQAPRCSGRRIAIADQSQYQPGTSMISEGSLGARPGKRLGRGRLFGQLDVIQVATPFEFVQDTPKLLNRGLW